MRAWSPPSICHQYMLTFKNKFCQFDECHCYLTVTLIGIFLIFNEFIHLLIQTTFEFALLWLAIQFPWKFFYSVGFFFCFSVFKSFLHYIDITSLSVICMEIFFPTLSFVYWYIYLWHTKVFNFSYSKKKKYNFFYSFLGYLP